MNLLLGTSYYGGFYVLITLFIPVKPSQSTRFRTAAIDTNSGLFRSVQSDEFWTPLLQTLNFSQRDLNNSCCFLIVLLNLNGPNLTKRITRTLQH